MPFALLFVVLSAALLSVLNPIPAAAEGASELRLRRIVFFNRFSQGKNYFLAGQYLEAASFYRSLMSQLNELPPFVQTQVRYYYGASLQELGIRQSALSYLIQVINQSIALNIWSDAVVRWVTLQRNSGDYESVSTIWQQASARIPTPKLLDPVRWAVGQSFTASGRYAEAIAVLDPIQPKSRYWGPARYLIATVLQKSGRSNAALEAYNELIRARGELARWGKESLVDYAQIASARILFDTAEYSRALAAYSKVSRAYSHLDEVSYEKAWCYAALEQYNPAVEELDRMIRTYPESRLSQQGLLLAGYFRMQSTQFGLSYATFVTAEQKYLALAKTMRRFIDQFPDSQMLGKTVMSPFFNTRGEFPEQVRQWILAEPVIGTINQIKNNIDGVDRLLNSIRGDIQEVQIITASYGASFKNPLTLELKVRDDVARSLATIQSSILEMMGREFRNKFRNNEYLVINRAQEVRKEILNSLDKITAPMRQDAINKQSSLASVADYLRLVRPDGFGLPPDPAVNGITVEVFGARVIDVFRQTLDDRQGLAQFLMNSAVDEDRLWGMVLILVEVERQALEAALRRLGVWGKYRYLIELDRLYRNSLGLQRLVEEFSNNLMQLRGSVLDEVMEETNQQRVTISELEEINESYREAVNTARYDAYAKAVRDVAFQVRETGIAGAIGQLDLSWRIHKLETDLHGRMQQVEAQRVRQIKGLYKRVLVKMDETGGATADLPAAVLRELGTDADSEEVRTLLRDIREAESLLSTGTGVYDELKKGSSALIDRPGVLQW